MKGSKSSGATRKADTKLAVKKTAAKGKAVKDPNKPKRPASAFFVFMEDFRKQFKEDHPDNKSVAAVSDLPFCLLSSKLLKLCFKYSVGKAGGAKWKLKLY
ncbi:HMG1/2-like protein [Lactuca sativa]|uniref:HMG1/2-like protein n=1 Tax=Lactuca sativa TaxID=4236 RepID=UPI0022AFDA3D|nr:HMG1/2-like protein [Lactuca sativa]